ncbi:MAG: SurA N-terminal domain-containing protein [Muribaculaceae bacterium]|nr:SurA N-terminal domain-containing protein [Muribaculaceae bacterium]
MATLEKIRQHQVLLFVVIIVALLAFILGDFLTSGRTYFGSGTTVAKAGNAKVDYTEYQARVSAASENQRNSQRQADSDDLSQQVLQQLLLEKLTKQEYSDLGLVVTDGELTDALTGEYPHPAAQQFIYTVSQQLGLPAPSGQAVYDAMMNPAKYGLPAEVGPQLKQMWAGAEAAVEEAMLQEKFDRLMNGLFTASQLDAKSLYNDVATTRHISYVSQGYNSIPDDSVTITDADRRAAWQADKSMYRLSEPARAIDYIIVRIEPSQADRMAAQKEVEDALMTLNSTDGTEAIAANSHFVINTYSAPAARINDNRLKSFVDTAAVGQAAILSNSGDTYSIAKLLGKTNEIDSINVSMLARADQGSVDSLLTLVNGGSSFAELIDGTEVVGQDSTWASLAVAGIPANLKSALETNAVGAAFVLTDTIQGQPTSTLYRINKRRAAVPVYEMASISYTVDPSQETLTQLSNDLHTYVANNSSAEDFAANAAEAGYAVQQGFVSASSAHVANASDSRPAVKWIMDAKKGKVMPVYQDNKQTYLLAVAVTDAFNDEYVPFNSPLIADQVNAKAMKTKKAQMLKDKYAGKAEDLVGYAKLMGTDVRTGDAIFNAPNLATLGFGESALQGAVAAAEEGKIVGPVEGNNAVVIFAVTGQDNKGREYTFEEYANQFNRQLGLANPRGMQPQQRFNLLLGKEKIKNNSLNFVRGIGE